MMNDDQDGRERALTEAGGPDRDHDERPGLASGSELRGAPMAGAAAPGDATSPLANPAASRTGRKTRSFWRELPVLIVIALAIALVIKTFVVQAFYNDWRMRRTASKPRSSTAARSIPANKSARTSASRRPPEDIRARMSATRFSTSSY
jgi:hypothetical protein